MNLLSMMVRLFSLGVTERAGNRQHPAIQWAHELCKMGEGVADEIAWCSSIINLAAALSQRKRSQSAAARSWLTPSVGQMVTSPSAFKEMLRLMNQGGERNGVLIFKRGTGRGQLGADTIDAPGHVAVFVAYHQDADAEHVNILGGNQGNKMSYQWMPIKDLLGIVIVDSDTLSS
jgi:hypothetical protein